MFSISYNNIIGSEIRRIFKSIKLFKCACIDIDNMGQTGSRSGGKSVMEK